MIRAILLGLIALLTLASPARADDISAAGRSVVRVVVVAFEDGEIVDFGHGSGFAVAPNRIVTNAHVVALAAQYPKNTAVGVVPSEGSQSFGARVIAMDPRRDLALVELEEGTLPAVPLYVGPLEDGSPVAALGYPGNVDLATASSASDYIRPLPPTRSTGIFSNIRPINGVTTLLHTASIARGHSGGPLLDPCGRVLGVNTLITAGGEGAGASFYFAVSNRDLAAFLREAGQAFQNVSTPCVSMAESLRGDEARAMAEARARQAEQAERDRAAREAGDRALARSDEAREARLGIAIVLLVLSLVAFGAGGIMLVKDRQRPALILGGSGLALLAAAATIFLTRPGRDDAAVEAASAETAETPSASFVGRNLCALVAERSRVTVSSVDEVVLDWGEEGCVNGRTQYAQSGDTWSRILVPASEQTVSVVEFRPDSGEYVVSRYLLGAEQMARARALRENVELKTCTADTEARAILGDRQREIREVLPQLPNERLVYRCENAPDAAIPAAD
jgi:S1-C subfamily serine protease